MRYRTIWLVLYIAIWFLFGWYYKLEADKTNGAAFIFQDDLKVKSKCDAAFELFDRRIPPHLLEKVINESVDGRISWNFSWWKDFHPEYANIPAVPLSNLPIGSDWSYVYYALFNGEGLDWFTIESVSSEPYPLLRGTHEVDGYKFDPASAPELLRLKRVKFQFWKDPTLKIIQSRDERPSYKRTGRYLPRKERFLMAREVECYLLPEGFHIATETRELYPDGIYPLSHFQRILANSFNYLDDSPDKIKEVKRGIYERPLMDFLYFSAITITTVGFGDILPNRTNIRIAVMAEALLGVLLIGIYITALFNNTPGNDVAKGQELRRDGNPGELPVTKG